MNFYPVLPGAVLIGLAVLVVVVRMATLYRLLVRTSAGKYRAVVTRWSGLTLAMLLLVVAAYRPGFDSDRLATQQVQVSTTGTNLNVFFVVDRSVNSRVEDYAPGKSRMSGIRADIVALMDEYPTARYGLISFASKASVDWPISEDGWSMRSLAKGLSPYTLVPRDAMYQVDATAAKDALREQLERAAQLYPRSKNLVFYFGEGAPDSRVQPGAFDAPQGAIAGGAVLGYGSDAGGAIPQGWANGTKGYQVDQVSGALLNSKIDEARLKSIASSLGVPYFHRGPDQSITPVVPAVEQSSTTIGDGPVEVDKLIDRYELYWVFALMSAALLLVEAVLSVREFRRNRLSRKDLSSEDVIR